ncbi:MAG TPA: amidohydrolase family protein, partial [Edaphobacter sp.]
EADRAAMVAALVDGIADCIATDHAPHAAHEKEQEFERAPNGITGLETALGLALRVLHRGQGLSLSRIVSLMSTAPAEIVALAGRGSLAKGHYGDIVIFDAGAAWRYDAAQTRSKSRNTPFDGAEMLGRVKATICKGRIVYRG